MATPSAPRTPTSTRISSHSTPITATSSSLSQSSAQTQRELKQQVRMEYSGQVFGSKQLFSNIFDNTISENTMEIVIDDCIERFKSLPPFSSNIANEKLHYEPFVNRLNAVKDSLIYHNCMAESIYLRVKFEVYDRLMANGVGNDAPLRPDALARVPSGNPSDHVFWEDVELCVEVKNQYGEMVVQGTTYARSMFHAQRNRRFVLMIFYNHRLGRVSFGLFTPAWLCLSTNHHNLHEEGGQRGFIQDMAQIWSCKDRWSAGFEDWCNNVQCYLERFGTFSYAGNICYRTSLRGRRTRVDLIINGKIWTVLLLRYVDKSPLQTEYVMRPIQHQNEYDLPAESQLESGPLRFSARLAEKRLALSKGQGVNSPSELRISFTKPDPKYKTLILKDSWPLLSREKREAEVFGITKADGDEHENEKHQEFGIPVILGWFPVMNPQGKVSDTASTFPKVEELLPTIWNDDGPELSSNLQTIKSKSKPSSNPQTVESKPKSKPSSNPQTVEPHEPEERVHVRLLISTQGVPLEHADGPRQLLQAILHAMIGYSVIFRRRWLHRDVSIGNVLLMKTPKKRKRINGFENILTNDILEKYFKECTGFITDGDLAVNWDIPDREHAKQRSGTPPFMSCELLESMNEKAFHSAIDDLESFVWVLFWAVLSVMQLREAKFSKDEEKYWTSLKSRNLSTLYKKRGFPDTLLKQQIALSEREEQDPGDPPVENAPSSAFAPFVEVLAEWLTLAFSKEAIMTRHRLQRVSVAQHERIVQEWIGKYLSIGIQHLDMLPDTWNYITQ